MRKLTLIFLPLLLFAGCRLSRSPESLTPVQPAPSPTPVFAREKPAGAQPEPTTQPATEAQLPEETSPPAEVAPAQASSAPGARDYFDSLTAFLAQAKAEAGKGNITNLQSQQGTLAGANYSLSLLEANLPRVWTLQGLQRARQLLAAKKNAEASEVLGQLINSLGKANSALPTDMKSSAATIKKAQDNIISGKTDIAANQLGELVKQVAASTALTQMQEIRANLQEAWLAAQRNQPAVVKAILEDTGQYLAKLAALLPASQIDENKSQ
jgi:hypothetical protein